jgi:hypothetical protein
MTNLIDSPIEPLISIKATRELLGVSHSAMFRLLKRGELDTVWVGGQRMVEPAALRRFLAEHREPRAGL